MTSLPTVLRIGVAALVLWSGAARAQVGGSIVVESDYRFRGVSLSGEKPTAHLSLSYDHPAGWYAGASLAGVQLEPHARQAGALAYAGYARRDGAGRTWELGATFSRFFGVEHYDYAELFTGLIAERWNARVYLSPDYFGRGVRTLYAELNGALALTPQLRSFAHLGVLAPLGGDTAFGIGQPRYDGRLGLGLRISDLDIQLAWVGTDQRVPYAGSYEQQRNTVVLSASFSF